MKFKLMNRGHGVVQVHTFNCQDTRRNLRGASVWTEDADSYAELVWSVYPPEDFEYSPEDWQSFNDLKVCNCATGDIASLPASPQATAPKTDATPTAEPTPKATTGRRAQLSHRGHSHPQTPAARRACKALFWATVGQVTKETTPAVVQRFAPAWDTTFDGKVASQVQPGSK